ncbi:MAG: ATP-binding protein [Bryobacteraceae bacterium]
MCPVCGGTGWKIVERDEISGAERCDCQYAERMKRLEVNAGIPVLYQQASFDNFKLPDDNPVARSGLASVMLTVKSFVRDYPSDKKPGLLLIGEPGTGKTHLAVAALRMLLGRGFEGYFFDYQTLLDRIRAGYDPTSHSSAKEAYTFALETELLMLDDLGAHRVTDWVEDTVTSIITHRCNNRKPLIATTNLSDPDAETPGEGTGGKLYSRTTLSERIGSRARSRLFEMCRVVRMPLVEDFRVRKSARF